MDTDKKSFLECSYSDRQTPYERHFHNAYELVFICEGRVRFEIGQSCYDVGANTILFISKLEEHNLRILSGTYRRYFILLTPSQLDRLIDDPKLKSVFISRPSGFCHAFDLNIYADRVGGLLENMLLEHQHPGSFSRHASQSLFNLLMILCYRAKKEDFPLPSKRFSRAVFDIQKYIDRHFTEEINLEELSARFYISPSYLSHTFREWTGSSPKQYIMRSRIAYAKEILITTDLSVSDIAVRCGFMDVSNFIRSFKKETSQTPMQYRFNNK